jgi:hypothetical protein
VGAGGVGLGESHVLAHHIKCGMAQYSLEAEHVAAVAEKPQGHRVAKPMWVDFGDASAFPELSQHVADARAIHRVAVEAHKERIIVQGFGVALREVAP